MGGRWDSTCLLQVFLPGKVTLVLGGGLWRAAVLMLLTILPVYGFLGPRFPHSITAAVLIVGATRLYATEDACAAPSAAGSVSAPRPAGPRRHTAPPARRSAAPGPARPGAAERCRLFHAALRRPLCCGLCAEADGMSGAEERCAGLRAALGWT